TAFNRLPEAEHVQGITLRAAGFQKLKEPLRRSPGFTVVCLVFVRRTRFLTIFVQCTICRQCPGSRASGPIEPREKGFMMFKVEDFQNYGKEQFEQCVASATTVQNGLQAIASAYGDYTKKSFEDTKSFVEKLSGVKSLDKALEAQTDFARSTYETFVAESQKI